MKYLLLLLLISCSPKDDSKKHVKSYRDNIDEMNRHFSFDSSQIAFESKLRGLLLQLGHSKKAAERIIDSQCLDMEKRLLETTQDSTRWKWYLEFREEKKANLTSP